MKRVNCITLLHDINRIQLSALIRIRMRVPITCIGCGRTVGMMSDGHFETSVPWNGTSISFVVQVKHGAKGYMATKPHLYRSSKCHCYPLCQYFHCVTDVLTMFANTLQLVDWLLQGFKVIASSQSSKWFGDVKEHVTLGMYQCIILHRSDNIWHLTKWLWYNRLWPVCIPSR